MKLAMLGLAATVAIGIGAGSASAQTPVVVGSPYAGPVVVSPGYPGYPVYSPGVTVATPGLSVGVYAPGPVVGVVPTVGFGFYPGYRGGYYPAHYYHGRR